MNGKKINLHVSITFFIKNNAKIIKNYSVHSDLIKYSWDILQMKNEAVSSKIKSALTKERTELCNCDVWFYHVIDVRHLIVFQEPA